MLSTKNDWQNFIETGKDPSYRENISISWKKCRKSQLKAEEKPSFLNSKSKVKKTKIEEIEFMKEVGQRLQPVIKRNSCSSLAWILLDSRASVIKVLSDNEDYKKELGDLGLMPGASTDEAYMGTNAFYLSHKVKHLTSVRTYEHYLSCFHPYMSSCSPIYSIEGKIIGYLGIIAKWNIGDFRLISSMLSLSIQSIDTKIRLERSAEGHSQLKGTMGKLFKVNQELVLMLDQKGDLKHANPAAIKTFKLHEQNLTHTLDQTIAFKPSLSELASRAVLEEGLRIEAQVGQKNISLLADKKPCYDHLDQYSGIILTLTESQSKKTTSSMKKKTELYTFDDLMGDSLSILHAKRLAQQVATCNIGVLLVGESGTGKEMFAQSIHQASAQASGPFVSVNCAAIPMDIAESELFGYSGGAFTGALSEGKKGKLEAANGGTMFLDEIGDMPIELQAKLLRVLENRSLTRLGEVKEIPIDVRIVAATHHDLLELIDKKLFREDLYYRLCVSIIKIPSLSDSPEDIPELFKSFYESFSAEMGKVTGEIDRNLLEGLKKYHWRGNIRELRNAAEFAVMMNSGHEELSIQHLPGKLRMSILYGLENEETSEGSFAQEKSELVESEKKLLQKAMRNARGHVGRAAEAIGMSRATLYRKIKKFDLRVRA